MAKAGTRAGELISDATYGPDYATARGEMDGLRAAAVERKCNFVPGVDSPDARASDRARPAVYGMRRITTSDPSARPSAIAAGRRFPRPAPNL